MPTGEIGFGGGSVYPGSLDVNATPEVNSPNAGKTKARKEVVEDLSAIVIAIETELGTDPRGTAASVRANLQKGHNTDGTHLAWIDAADYSNFTNAITAAAGKTLLIRSNISIAAAYTFPSGVNIEVTHAGSFTYAAGGSLTWAAGSSLVAPPGKQIFINFGTANVTFGADSVIFIYPRWFGAIGDGSTDSTTPLQAFVNCCARSHTNGMIPKGHFKCTKLYFTYDATNNPNYPTGTNEQGRFKIIGAGNMEVANLNVSDRFLTVIESTDTTGPGFNIFNNAGSSGDLSVRQIYLEGMTLIANNSTYVLSASDLARCGLTDISIHQKGANGGGVSWINYDQSEWDNVIILGNTTTFATGTGLRMYSETAVVDGSVSDFANIKIRGFTNGHQIGFTTYNQGNFQLFNIFRGVIATNVSYGLILGDEVGMNTFIGCQYRGQIKGMYSTPENYSNTFIGCQFGLIGGGSALYGMHIGIAASNNYNINMRFINCWWHCASAVTGTPTMIYIDGDSNVQNISIQGGRVWGNSIALGVQYNGKPHGGEIDGLIIDTCVVDIVRHGLNAITSAGTITMVADYGHGTITGSTTIYSVTPFAPTPIGKQITLSFAGSATAILQDIINITAVTLTSLTSSGTTATATKVGHGFATGDGIVISGASPDEYNGYYVITVSSADVFTYAFPSSGTSPATGTILATRGNLKLNRDFTYSTGYGLQRRIRLQWDGTYWWEVSRNSAIKADILTTANLPAAATSQDGRLVIEDNGAGDQNLIIYSNGQRFRIDGGAAF